MIGATGLALAVTLAEMTQLRTIAMHPRTILATLLLLGALTSWEATLARRKEWWSYRPIRAPAPPPATEWSDHPVDRFVQRELDRRGLVRAGRHARLPLRRMSWRFLR